MGQRSVAVVCLGSLSKCAWVASAERTDICQLETQLRLEELRGKLKRSH